MIFYNPEVTCGTYKPYKTTEKMLEDLQRRSLQIIDGNVSHEDTCLLNILSSLTDRRLGLRKTLLDGQRANLRFFIICCLQNATVS